MANNKLAIIGGSGLYDVEEFKERELIKLDTPWGKPSDDILKTNIIIKRFIFFQDTEGGTLYHLQKLILEPISIL